MSKSTAPHTWPSPSIKDPLQKEALITLNADQTHYLGHMLHVQTDTPIRLFNKGIGPVIEGITII